MFEIDSAAQSTAEAGFHFQQESAAGLDFFAPWSIQHSLVWRSWDYYNLVKSVVVELCLWDCWQKNILFDFELTHWSYWIDKELN